MKKGLVIVYTGDGKGKTTAALGAALRMIAHGKKVAMVQFFKTSGRLSGMSPRLRVWSFGGGFTWRTDRKVNSGGVTKCWEKCRGLLRDPKYSLVIFDEINIALKHKFLKVSDVLKALQGKNAAKHVILTGRGAPRAILRYAGLVTEMKCRKHPYHYGIPALPGLDF